MVSIERVAEGCKLGEGPHWDLQTQTLYFVDILANTILKYNPSTEKLSKATLEKSPSFIIPVCGRKDEFVVGAENELQIISWDGENDKVTIKETLAIAERTGQAPSKRFNDAKCDSSGRLWIGNHSGAVDDFLKTQPLGSLQVYENGDLKNRLEEIRIANGLAFDDKTKKMYYIDSLKGTVDKFDFDINAGQISNRQVWFTLKKSNVPGLPDGMTIDTDGNLWVAVFGGGRVLKVDGSKSENLLVTVHLPAEQVTSVAFGGKQLDELYVTTGAFQMNKDAKKLEPPEHGALYKIKGTGSKGITGVSIKL